MDKRIRESDSRVEVGKPVDESSDFFRFEYEYKVLKILNTVQRDSTKWNINLQKCTNLVILKSTCSQTTQVK
jgi:hypothetical protein